MTIDLRTTRRRRSLAAFLALLLTLATVLATAPHHHNTRQRAERTGLSGYTLVTVSCSLCDWAVTPCLPAGALPIVFLTILFTVAFVLVRRAAICARPTRRRMPRAPPISSASATL